MSKPLSHQCFSNRFTDFFSGDFSMSPVSRNTPGVLFSAVGPTPVKTPVLLAWSKDMAATLGLRQPDASADLHILSGNKLPANAVPYASCYGGHQFGHWAGQLGDGRVINFGELKDGNGDFWELQLKGAGRTPYSRRADGRAVLRSSVREYLAGEAMHYLGVPTTRALSLVATGEAVLRDMFYDGHPAYERGAVVCRVSPSFLRFGHFELPAARNEVAPLQQLLRFTIDRFYSKLKGSDEVIGLFHAVCKRTARLMSEWMRVGFVHGVMNTDNMSMLGLTIDYGPFAFLDQYDEQFTSNTTDLPRRRYAFGEQPAMAHWNLGCLAGALSLLHKNESDFIEILEAFPDMYWKEYEAMMGRKLGFTSLHHGDEKLIATLQHFIKNAKPDMTLFFQLLIVVISDGLSEEEAVREIQTAFYPNAPLKDTTKLISFLQLYLRRLEGVNKSSALETMRANNPAFIPRNYLLHTAAQEMEAGDDILFKKLSDAITTPYENRYPELSGLRPEWAANAPGCSMLSCSS